MVLGCHLRVFVAIEEGLFVQVAGPIVDRSLELASKTHKSLVINQFPNVCMVHLSGLGLKEKKATFACSAGDVLWRLGEDYTEEKLLEETQVHRFLFRSPVGWLILCRCCFRGLFLDNWWRFVSILCFVTTTASTHSRNLRQTGEW